MGTGPFAVPMFRALYGAGHRIAALVTQPTRPVRGNRPPPPNPMRQVAEEHGTPVLDPEKINTDEARAAIARFAPDLFVVADYGQILAPETLALTRLGGINLHGSLLPKYRGAAPINWAIYKGDAETGVTVIHMTPRVDAGPAIAKARIPIDSEETAIDLEHRLAELGAPLVCQTVDRLAAGKVESLPQDSTQASPARRLRKTDGEVDWSRSAAAIKNQVRALEPWPRTSTNWLREGGEPLRIILGRVSVKYGTADAPPGTVLPGDKGELLVATGEGILSLDEVQPAGKRSMAAAEFLRGHLVIPGQRFGPIES
jgi:methionyl-tRNA formyltransferase